jgi:hypothetical protein
VLTLVVLGVVLLFLFHRSLQAGGVLFANDAPLGPLEAYYPTTLGFFTGAWHQLHWIGMLAPSALPDLSYGFMLAAGPLWYSKFFVPFALLLLGLSAALFCRALGFGPWTCGIVALAATLNGDAFSHACWGLPSVTLGMAMMFLALAAVADTRARWRWHRLVLAGGAVGMGIMESYDVGAIHSLYVAAFVLVQAWADPGHNLQRWTRGVWRVGLVAVSAAAVAAVALSTLVGTQIRGVRGMAQDAATKAQRWHEATQWSLPKVETLRLVVPGLFGYRMDTPDGGWYWGGVGRDARWDEYLASQRSDPAQAPRGALMRHSGAGFYAGAFVVAIAAWGTAQLLRRQGGPYSPHERRQIGFWAVAAGVSLVLAFGRHAPFYQLLYALPFFSTIRNPIKFLHPLEISVLILFGYGLEGLWRSYLASATPRLRSGVEQLQAWWKTAPTPDRRAALASVGVVVIGLLGWLFYASSREAILAHLARVGFPEPEMAAAIVRFSVGEVGWTILFLILAAGWLIVVMSGALAGARARWAWILAGVFLVMDLARANAPWIVYYDYQEKYASSPVLDFLRGESPPDRVAGRMLPRSGVTFTTKEGDVFASLYNVWLEHVFPYYRIQSIDIVQMPRTPELDEAYLRNFQPTNNTDFRRAARLWELTSTRYILGMSGFVDYLNREFDPAQQRFRVRLPFTLTPKPGVQQVQRLEELTTTPLTNGPFAVIEFTGALPRAKLYSRWQVVTNDEAALQELAAPAFNPAEMVLVSDEIAAPPEPATNAAPGEVSVTSHEPKRVRLTATVAAPALLLLNDRYHPDWRVYVDDRPEPLLRCNHIMRGVRLAPGSHQVEFRFEPRVRALYLSLAAIAVNFVLLGLGVARGRASHAG